MIHPNMVWIISTYLYLNIDINAFPKLYMHALIFSLYGLFTCVQAFRMYIIQKYIRIVNYNVT